MRIGYFLEDNILDQNTWSGIPYNIFNGLKRSGNDVLNLSPINLPKILIIEYFIKLIFRKFLDVVQNKSNGKTFYTNRILKYYSNYIIRNANKFKIDLIISTSSIPFYYYKSNKPYLLICDATVKLLQSWQDNGTQKNYYDKLEFVSKKSAKNAKGIIACTKWCKKSLVNDYGIIPEDIEVIPFGANIHENEIEYEEKGIIYKEAIKFLFVGKDFYRKGADIAINILDKLIEKKYKVQFTIIGTLVPAVYKREYLINIPFLNKNAIEDNRTLLTYFKDSHFFIMPSKFEPFGIVYAEAAAFGLPVIAQNVCGIEEIIIDKETGILFDINDSIEDTVNNIEYFINDNIKYKSLSINSRKRYERYLNWDNFSTKMLKFIKEF